METALVLAGVLVGALIGVLVGRVLGAQGSAARVQAAELDAARLRVQLETERQMATERLAAAQGDQRRLTDQFRAVAAEALAANNDQFLGLAEQRLRATQQSHEAALATREQAVRTLVEPIATVLDEVRAEVTAAEQARLVSQSALGEQVRAMRETSDLLRSETGQLVTALRSSQVRGRWGELQLRRVVEAACLV